MAHGRKKTPLSPQDVELWRRFTQTVTPLGPDPSKTDAGAHPQPETDPKPDPPPEDRSPPPRISARPGRPSPRRTNPDAELTHGVMPGVDRRTAARLKRGQMAVEARLDLHGFTRESAHSALGGFITNAYHSGLRCVLVVTGKGLRGEDGGVLRRAVPAWLNDAALRSMVLGFTHARKQDGGEGALYVLIRRKRAS